MRVIDFKDASCRHCYKCVRHCEVKAISVENEQAHIMKDHCINCGHCLESVRRTRRHLQATWIG